MSPRLTLDPSSFERLLAAALVIQHRNEQEARYRLLVPDKTPVDRRTEVHSPEVTAGAGKNLRASFARYRVKTWITLDSKLTLGPHRAVAKAVAPVSVLLIVVAFTLTQVWHRDHFHAVAAASTTNHLSEEAIKRADQLRSIATDRISHRQVTDRDVSSVVEGLSKYEIPALRRQAHYGDDAAAYLIGMLYETGHFVPQSCARAADWVMASANSGNAAAQYNLGLRYRDGDGVTANPDEAAKWLRKAADRRYSDATLALETLTSGDPRSTSSTSGITDALAAGSVSR